METKKFNEMISAFQCDFSLARDELRNLSELDVILHDNKNNKELLKHIELLEELEILLRYGKATIVLNEEVSMENNVTHENYEEEFWGGDFDINDFICGCEECSICKSRKK
jgi:predicted nucleotidyltransferase